MALRASERYATAYVGYEDLSKHFQGAAKSEAVWATVTFAPSALTFSLYTFWLQLGRFLVGGLKLFFFRYGLYITYIVRPSIILGVGLGSK